MWLDTAPLIANANGIGDDLWRIYHPGIYPSLSGTLSLAVPPLVGAMSTVDGFGHRWEKNGAAKVTTVWRFINQFINTNICLVVMNSYSFSCH